MELGSPLHSGTSWTFFALPTLLLRPWLWTTLFYTVNWRWRRDCSSDCRRGSGIDDQLSLHGRNNQHPSSPIVVRQLCPASQVSRIWTCRRCFDWVFSNLKMLKSNGVILSGWLKNIFLCVLSFSWGSCASCSRFHLVSNLQTLRLRAEDTVEWNIWNNSLHAKVKYTVYTGVFRHVFVYDMVWWSVFS